MLSINGLGFLLLYGLMRFQHLLPLNPQGFAAVPPDLAFNTAVSFVTNTNWQSYGGETTMSHLVQMAGLTVQNFLSAATGIALALAVTRAFARSSAATLGNFWADMTRATLYVLLPLSIFVALAFALLGVPQTLSASTEATTLEGAKQVIALGPVASQEAIKQLGTNGGGFFNVNASHPFENPNAWSNILSIWSMLLISTALPFTFGRLVGDMRQGVALLAVMYALLVTGVAIVYAAETSGVPLQIAAGVDPAMGNMEGKEVRFGQALTALYVVATTGLSCGAVNAMHNSLTPIGGLVPLFMIQLGEILPGGVGSGLYGIIVMAILAVFVAGLMVGRTPEYLGKKIEAREMKLAVLAILILPLAILGFTAASAMLPFALIESGQRRTARIDGNSLRLLVCRRQQRLGLRWAYREYALVQHHARHRDAPRPLCLRRAGSGHCGSLGQENKSRRIAGNLSDARHAVHRPAHRRDPDPRRPAILPCAGARTDCRTRPHASRQDVLKEQTMSSKPIALFDPGILRRAAIDAVVKLAPRQLVRNPVMFVTGVVALFVTLIFIRDLATGAG